MKELIEELVKTAQALQSVEVNGKHWLTMYASYNSIMMVVTRLQEEIEKRTVTDNGISDKSEP